MAAGNAEQAHTNDEVRELLRRFVGQVEGTVKRSYSQGRLNAEDDGDLAAALTVVKGKIVIDFGKRYITWLAMSVDEAEVLAKLILSKVQEIREGVV